MKITDSFGRARPIEKEKTETEYVDLTGTLEDDKKNILYPAQGSALYRGRVGILIPEFSDQPIILLQTVWRSKFGTGCLTSFSQSKNSALKQKLISEEDIEKYVS